ncbi:hypothetical protein ACFWN1_33170 [Streptomyces sp. NPDC058459]|uniref:hypothetical protein n=1 Tax=Streptomyces sp. NPDC058459 TaxID=3346508 RepID=UPI00365A55E0
MSPRASPPLEALSAGMPPRYRAAVADHPQVLDWARTVAGAAVIPTREPDDRSPLDPTC